MLRSAIFRHNGDPLFGQDFFQHFNIIQHHKDVPVAASRLGILQLAIVSGVGEGGSLRYLALAIVFFFSAQTEGQ